MALATVENLRMVFERVDSTDPIHPTQLIFRNQSQSLMFVLSFWGDPQMLRITLEFTPTFEMLDGIAEEILDIDVDRDDLLIIAEMGGPMSDALCTECVRVINKCLNREICECGLSFIDNGKHVCLRCQLFQPPPEDLRKCPICLAESHKSSFLETPCCHQEMHILCHAKWSAIKHECSLCRLLPPTSSTYRECDLEGSQ